MAGDAQEVATAISDVAKAYVSGDEDFVNNHLHGRAHVVGSEANESWRGHYDVHAGLQQELAELRGGSRTVRGPLVEAAMNPSPSDVKVRGDVAWWSYSGNIALHGEDEQESTWSVVLERDHHSAWKVVHSHFSIHRQQTPRES